MSHYEEMENTLKENEFIFLIENSPCTVMGLWQHWTFEKVYTAVSALFGFCIQMDFHSQLSELLQTLKWEIKPEVWEDETCHSLLVTLQLAMQTKIQRRYWCISEVVTLVEFSKWQNPAKTRGRSWCVCCATCRWAGGDEELVEVLLCPSILAEGRCKEEWKPASWFLLTSVADD